MKTLKQINDFRQYVLEHPNLVSMKETSLDGVFVLKYKNKVFYKNLWNDFLVECRGTLVDSDFNVISRPPTKIFNYGENNAEKYFREETEVIASEKINGFMASATWYNNDILVSTTGSIDSNYAKLAKSYLLPYKRLFEEFYYYTFTFEIVDSNDPHIIQEKQGAYLLSARFKNWLCDNHVVSEEELDNMAREHFGLRRPLWVQTHFGHILELSKDVKHEGFVVWSLSDELKLKSPYYLAKKFLMRYNKDTVLYKERIDEEYYPLIDHINNNFTDFKLLTEQERGRYIENYFGVDI